MSINETATVTITFNILLRQDESGWWHAMSRFGSTSAATKEECVRILKERATA